MSVSEQSIKSSQSDFADPSAGGGIRAEGRASEAQHKPAWAHPEAGHHRARGQRIVWDGGGDHTALQRLRFDYDPELDERLKARIERMGTGELGRIVRAFSVYFQLVNIAERYHRIRRRRQYESSPDNPPQRASLRSALTRLKTEGMSGAELKRLLDGMSLSLVLTAHPTETQKRSIRQKHLRIGNILKSLEVENLTPRKRLKAEQTLAEEITVL